MGHFHIKTVGICTADEMISFARNKENMNTNVLVKGRITL